jgi:hypothetical protein
MHWDLDSCHMAFILFGVILSTVVSTFLCNQAWKQKEEALPAIYVRLEIAMKAMSMHVLT